MIDNPERRLGAAVQEIVRRFNIEGTPVEGEFTRYGAPWYLVDTSKADLEVGYPGDLLGEFANWGDAQEARLTCIGRAVRTLMATDVTPTPPST